MATDKPPYWSHPEGKTQQTLASTLCCGGCYQMMGWKYGASMFHKVAVCRNDKCDQFGQGWQIPKDEDTP